MLKTHKIALDINDKQRTYLAKCAGTARFAYNWALDRWNEQYECCKLDSTLKKPSQCSLRRELNAIKREHYPWMMEVTKCAPQESIIDLGKAFTNFFAGRAKYPRFKKRGIHDSFRVSSGFFSIAGDMIKLPHIGWLKMTEHLRYKDAKLVSVTISRRADRWFVSVVCEVPETVKPCGTETIGIDLGVREIVLSNGERYPQPRAYRQAERRLRRKQKELSRKQKRSKNYAKCRRKVARHHARVTDIRNDFLHKLTNKITARASLICLEDLNVKGMLRNHKLAKSIADAGFGEFRRQMIYKAAERESVVITANRFYPSSHICSVCGAKTKHLPLSKRSWECESCGTQHDRDLNAAINLKNYAVSSTVSACGGFFATDCSHQGERISDPDEAGTKQQNRPLGTFV
jgi:putative transposase